MKKFYLTTVIGLIFIIDGSSQLKITTKDKQAFLSG